ncbi:MAG: hypothetical protein Q7U36_00875 [bacterium]|nr:hypothetical protein [bacterium]
MFIIRQARIDILATMKLSEEILNPISKEYYSLLEEKMNEGVLLFRIAFGSENDLHELEKRCPHKTDQYKCMHVKNKNYQRMLLVDRKWLFFATDVGNERKFFFTEDNFCIEVFERYFIEEIVTEKI